MDSTVKSIKFEDHRVKIQDAIQYRLKIAPIPYENGFSLIEGFLSSPVRQEFGNDIFLGGSTIPTVGVIGNTTGRIYTFALKAILPEIEI